MNESLEAVLTIKNELGLHARAATMFVQTASQYQAELVVSKDGREVNGKSIMGILTLVAAKGSKIHIRAKGKDAENMIIAISDLVAKRFMEER